MPLSEIEYERRAKVLRESGDIYDQYHSTADLPDELRTIPKGKPDMTIGGGGDKHGFTKEND